MNYSKCIKFKSEHCSDFFLCYNMHMASMVKSVKNLHNDWMYGKIIAMSICALSFFTLLFQLMWSIRNPEGNIRYPYIGIIIIMMFGIILYTISYVFDQRKHKQIDKMLYEDLFSTPKPTEKKKIVRPPYAFDVASWKLQGMMNYTARSRAFVQELVLRFMKESEHMDQVHQELYILKALMDTLLYELDHDEIKLSCVDIFYIHAKMETYYIHKQKGIYEGFKKDKSIPEQHQINLFLDERTRDILMFKLKERYAFLPSDFPKNFAHAVKSVEDSADEGNAYAQFDLANIYLSSEFYGGMEAAIFYLYRAQNEGHPSAMEFIDRLRSA